MHEFSELGLVILFFVIATLYSSAGFGGGSSYIALLSLTAFPVPEIRLIALICNIGVVSINTWSNLKHKLLPLKRALKISLFSIPFAFIGGSISLNLSTFTYILGFSLLIISGIMSAQILNKLQNFKLPKINNFILSGSIGLLSGLIGIGGGIFLSPILFLSNWGKAKQIAATASLFILLNSLSGLCGLLCSNWSYFSNNFKHGNLVVYLLLSVVLGSLLGQQTNRLQGANQRIKGITAILLFAVSIRLILNG